MLYKWICGINKYMLFTGWEVRIVKNCDRGLENAAAALENAAWGLWPRLVFHVPYLWNEAGDPNFYFISETSSHYLSTVEVKKKSIFCLKLKQQGCWFV